MTKGFARSPRAGALPGGKRQVFQRSLADWLRDLLLKVLYQDGSGHCADRPDPHHRPHACRPRPGQWQIRRQAHAVRASNHPLLPRSRRELLASLSSRQPAACATEMLAVINAIVSRVKGVRHA